MTFSLAILAVVLVYTWGIAPDRAALGGGCANARGARPLGLAGTPQRRVGCQAVRVSAGVAVGGGGDIGGNACNVSRRLALRHLARSTRRLEPSGGARPWGLGQQFALQTVFLREAQAALSKSSGIWLAALLFAALHLPNPFLTAATALGALAWCWIYDRHPNLLPLALSHAVVTLAILYAFDDTVTGGLRVGAAYWSR